LEETRSEQCKRLYAEAVPNALEELAVDALFDVYPAANATSNALFVPNEVRFGGGHVRRGMLEKRVGDAVVKVGGLVEPQFTYRLTAAGLRVETSYYSLFRLKEIVFTISSVSDEYMQPRFARFRKDFEAGRIPKAAIPFAFVEEKVPAPAPDAAAWFVLKHGKEPFDSTVPQFAHMTAIDQGGKIVWYRNLFLSQFERVQWWVGQREVDIKDDPALVTLKIYLRRLRNKRGA